MTIVLKNGDLFTSDAPAIGHGINCMGAMKKGIAVEFSSRYPEMYQQYWILCRNKSIEPGGVYWYNAPDGRVIANLASQFRPGPDARYEWITKSLENALVYMEKNGLPRIAIPRIGTGIGSLSWDQVYYNLVYNFEDSDIVIEVWSL